MPSKTGTSNISVKWSKYGLEAVITVTASVVIPRASFSMTIEGLTADPDGGYGFIPSASTSELYHIALEDDIGTTEDEWVEKYNSGELKFSLQSSWTSIVVSSNKLYLQKTTNGTTGILSRYVRATITDEFSPSGMTAESGVQLPPYASTFTLYNCSKLTSRTACTTDGWNYQFKGSRQYFKWVTSGTELTCMELKKLADLGILSSSSQLSNIDEENDVNRSDCAGSSSSTSSTYNIGWKDGNSYSQQLLSRTWMAYYGITIFGVASTTAGASGGYNSFTNLTSHKYWYSTDENTYSGSVTSSDYLALYLSDPRIPTSELCSVLQFTRDDMSSTNASYQQALKIEVLANKASNGDGTKSVYISPCAITKSSLSSNITSDMYQKGNCYGYATDIDAVIIAYYYNTGIYSMGSYFWSQTGYETDFSQTDYLKIKISGYSSSTSAYAGGVAVMYSYYIYFEHPANISWDWRARSNAY